VGVAVGSDLLRLESGLGGGGGEVGWNVRHGQVPGETLSPGVVSARDIGGLQRVDPFRVLDQRRIIALWTPMHRRW